MWAGGRCGGLIRGGSHVLPQGVQGVRPCLKTRRLRPASGGGFEMRGLGDAGPRIA